MRVVPGAKKSEIAGDLGDRIRIRLQAPPVEGKANKELLKFLSRSLGLKKNQISLAAGERSREKTVLISNVSLADARKRLRSAFGEE